VYFYLAFNPPQVNFYTKFLKKAASKLDILGICRQSDGFLTGSIDGGTFNQQFQLTSKGTLHLSASMMPSYLKCTCWIALLLRSVL